jgi:hypothetical protein
MTSHHTRSIGKINVVQKILKTPITAEEMESRGGSIKRGLSVACSVLRESDALRCSDLWSTSRKVSCWDALIPRGQPCPPVPVPQFFWARSTPFRFFTKCRTLPGVRLLRNSPFPFGRNQGRRNQGQPESLSEIDFCERRINNIQMMACL